MSCSAIYTPLASRGGCRAPRFEGITCDGGLFYLTAAGCRIHTYDLALKPLRTLRTCRTYTGITYDRTRGCFWCSTGRRGALYMLGADMREIGAVTVEGGLSDRILSLSYDAESDTLQLAAEDCILEVDSGGCVLGTSAPVRGAEAYFAVAHTDGGLTYAYRAGKIQPVTAQRPDALSWVEAGDCRLKDMTSVIDGGGETLCVLAEMAARYPYIIRISASALTCGG
ncbi:hypothetical protein LJC32_01730 [Oscillospiraceae bacterium OttesenSCG-928-F05]|nr:hypothetical protein [Oscillospiraceae bacterium OttesenSCG-928-F05]